MSAAVTPGTPGAITDGSGLVVAVVRPDSGIVTVTEHGISTGYPVSPSVVYIPAVQVFVDTATGELIPQSQRTGLLAKLGQPEILLGLAALALIVWRKTA
jgi:hypothetical protein